MLLARVSTKACRLIDAGIPNRSQQLRDVADRTTGAALDSEWEADEAEPSAATGMGVNVTFNPAICRPIDIKQEPREAVLGRPKAGIRSIPIGPCVPI